MEGLGIISTPLCAAAHKGHLATIQQLLQKGQSMNLADNTGATPLHIAAAQGHVECTKFLLAQEECNPHAQTFEGFTTLYVACKFQNNSEIVRILIDAGVDCNRGDNENVTPLHVACMNFKYEIAQELIRGGANINSQDFNSFTSLMSTIEKYGDNEKLNGQRSPLDIVCLLLDHGADLSAVDLHGRTSLFLAVWVEWEACVKLLIEHGAAVNARAVDGTTPLMMAAEKGNLSIVQHLLLMGANPFLKCCDGSSAMQQALHNGHVRIARQLLKEMKGYDIAKDCPRPGLLILAVDSGSLESVEFVLENKLTHPTLDRQPMSLMHYRQYKFQSPLSFLLSNHIDEIYSVPMFNSLLQSGSFSVNATTVDELPPLCAVIRATSNEEDSEVFHKNQMTLFSKLLEEGADIDYCSCVEIGENSQIPDAVLDAVLFAPCSRNNILVPVLAHCFSCKWNELLEYLLKNHVCSVQVVITLLSLTPKIPVSAEIWTSSKKCNCETCEDLSLNAQRMMCPRVKSLQCLSRSALRSWLWEMTHQSSKAEQLLKRLKIPEIIEEYIIPTTLVVKEDD